MFRCTFGSFVWRRDCKGGSAGCDPWRLGRAIRKTGTGKHALQAQTVSHFSTSLCLYHSVSSCNWYLHLIYLVGILFIYLHYNRLSLVLIISTIPLPMRTEFYNVNIKTTIERKKRTCRQPLKQSPALLRNDYDNARSANCHFVEGDQDFISACALWKVGSTGPVRQTVPGTVKKKKTRL